MEKIYGILGIDVLLSVVKAKSKEEAFDIFSKNQLDNQEIRQYISVFANDDCLLANFYKDDHGHFFDMTGDYTERLNLMNKKEMNEYMNFWFKKNAMNFWHDKPHFAEEYIKELEKGISTDELGNYVEPAFSNEFWIDTIKRVIQSCNWYTDFKIVEINLDNRNYQTIYEY